jgi:hypothetical protein
MRVLMSETKFKGRVFAGLTPGGVQVSNITTQAAKGYFTFATKPGNNYTECGVISVQEQPFCVTVSASLVSIPSYINTLQT